MSVLRQLPEAGTVVLAHPSHVVHAVALADAMGLNVVFNRYAPRRLAQVVDVRGLRGLASHAVPAPPLEVVPDGAADAPRETFRDG